MGHRNQWVVILYFMCLFASQARAGDEAAQEDEGTVKVADVLDAMQHNHAAADERYVGKRLQIRGRAQSVERMQRAKDGPVEYRLKLESEQPVTGGVRPSVSFVFAAKERAGLADITR